MTAALNLRLHYEGNFCKLNDHLFMPQSMSAMSRDSLLFSTSSLFFCLTATSFMAPTPSLTGANFFSICRVTKSDFNQNRTPPGSRCDRFRVDEIAGSLVIWCPLSLLVTENYAVLRPIVGAIFISALHFSLFSANSFFLDLRALFRVLNEREKVA